MSSVVLRSDGRTTRRALTTSGWQAIARRRLVAVDNEDHPDSVERCARLLGTASLYPLDMYLGIPRSSCS